MIENSHANDGSPLDRVLETASHANCDFSVDNLPFGVGRIGYTKECGVSVTDKDSLSTRLSSPRCLTALGDSAIDLSVLQEAGAFDGIDGLNANVFGQESLNKYMEHPLHVWRKVRKRLREVLMSSDDDSLLRSNRPLQHAAIHRLELVQMQLPALIGDYTDFYSSREHATNVGTMFRGKDKALQPNWLHLPVGYHGRASTVVCSGHPVVRPQGQLQKNTQDDSQGSVFGPCRLLDFELEVAFFVGGPANPPGQPVTMQEAQDRIFGFCLMNDWSARDIQKWEYVPLGPFTSKNFCTTISPWIVSTEALQAFRVPTSAVAQTNPVPLAYLQDPDYSSYDIQLSVAIRPEGDVNPSDSEGHVICRSNFANLYWNAAQQLVHHSVTGCVMNPGDLLASGTISGPTSDSFGSMLELSWRGSQEVPLGTHQTRKFLEDGDTVVINGLCFKDGLGRVGFGACSGKILPAGSKIVTADPARPDRFQHFKLYSRWKSSSSWRVRIALAAKNVPYEVVTVDLTAGENRKDWFLKKNPLGQIPVLEYTDTTTGKTHCLSQSVAILEFLDHAFPGARAVFPMDSMERVRATEILEVINSGTQPLQNTDLIDTLKDMTKDDAKVDEFRAEMIQRGLKVVEHRLQRRMEERNGACGPFAMGGFSPTVVDLYLVPQLSNARASGIHVQEEFPLLTAIDDTCRSHPWFTNAHPLAQPDAPDEERNTN